MRTFVLLAVTLLFFATHHAQADSIQLSITSSFTANVYSPNDNYWGEYSTARSNQSVSAVIHSITTTTFSSVSVFVPIEDYITSYSLKIIFPNNIQGTGSLHIEHSLPPPDWLSPSTAPTFGPTALLSVFVNDFHYSNGTTFYGNELTTGDLNLEVELGGQIIGNVGSPGVNWDSYVSGSGQVNIPYTVELDISYAPVPEPQTATLLITGIAGLAGIARRSSRTRQGHDSSRSPLSDCA